ncbi:YSC84-related protein [Pseudoroseicyclus tamaricis]|uniref:Twin-arginine translocation pathway signal n=1 Tax=Pseudoroseicyclus tamaricis TaxID=2705421 RepID=A0A6B2JUJ5_9RHOB|nr:YSC84-related protein [Pseudoroseicyclus tamaricis]NDV01730.1 twin-arginine translocation pathway signal [Pseudoroseicyclus tamaricis]
MITTTRRNLLAAGGASMALAACGNGIGSPGSNQIDARVDSTLQYMYGTYPGTSELQQQAAGMLVMPLVTEAGLGLGGSYGRGALRVGGATVDYYLATAASAGLQIGAQQYSHVLFFMTQDSLMTFRRSSGWSAGGDIEYALNNRGEMLRADVLTSVSPVIAVVFAQAGLRVGATIEGTKYTRIIP